MRRWISQQIDDLQLLHDRAGPPVRDNYRQPIRLFRPDVDEVNVETVDGGGELRVRIQLRFGLSPAVVRRPVARHLLHGSERHALRVVRNRLALRPLGRRDPSAQACERIVGGLELERPDRNVGARFGRRNGTDRGGAVDSHCVTPLSKSEKTERARGNRRRGGGTEPAPIEVGDFWTTRWLGIMRWTCTSGVGNTAGCGRGRAAWPRWPCCRRLRAGLVQWPVVRGQTDPCWPAVTRPRMPRATGARRRSPRLRK